MSVPNPEERRPPTREELEGLIHDAFNHDRDIDEVIETAIHYLDRLEAAERERDEAIRDREHMDGDRLVYKHRWERAESALAEAREALGRFANAIIAVYEDDSIDNATAQDEIALIARQMLAVLAARPGEQK